MGLKRFWGSLFVITPRFVPKHRLRCHVEHGLREVGRELGLVVRYDVDVGQVVPGDGGGPEISAS